MFTIIQDLQAQLRETQEQLQQALASSDASSRGEERTAENQGLELVRPQVQPVVNNAVVQAGDVNAVRNVAPAGGNMVQAGNVNVGGNVVQPGNANVERNVVNAVNVPRTNGFKFERFTKCGAKEFDGTLDAVGSMEWLDDIEVMFASSDCPEDKKVLCATRMLKRTARVWWRGATVSLAPGVLSAMPWGTFKEKFLEEYCGTREKRLLEKEFLTLEKGDKSMGDYARSFMEKLSFVGHLVPTEEAKIAAYTDGLPAGYRGICRHHSTLADAIKESKKLEDDFKVEKTVVKGVDDKSSGLKRKGEEVSGSNKKLKGGTAKDEGNKKKGEWCDRCKSRHTGHCTAATLRCNKCAGFGHLYRECTGVARCYHCKKTGHEFADCPQKAEKKKDEKSKDKA